MLLFYKDIYAKEIEIDLKLKKHGGVYSFREKLERGGVGVGGLKYITGCPQIDRYRKYQDTLVVNLEEFKNGLIIRFRNIEFHSMLIVDFEEIESIKLVKKADQVKFANWSLFRWLINRGVSYETARIFAKPVELPFIGDVDLTIQLKSQTLHLQNLEGFSGKLASFCQGLPIDNYEENVKKYVVIGF